MKTLPPIVVVADRGRLIAYRLDEADRPRVVANEEFAEGSRKLSELVTDQAGAFPVSGSIGTASAERLPLENELEIRCIRAIAENIQTIVREEKVGRWALVAPSQIHRAIVDHLPKEARECLVLQIKRDLINSPSKDVVEAMRRAAQEKSYA